jgi:hypothetical protein
MYIQNTGRSQVFLQVTGFLRDFRMTVMHYGRASLLLLLVILAFVPPVSCAPADNNLMPSEIAIRQAHLDWVALTTEVEMNAAITYISPLYSTDTARLNVLLADFKEQEAFIPATTTRAGFEDLTGEMRAVRAQFRNESGIQMTTGYGKWNDLSLQVRAATTNNPYIDEKQQAYWSVRRTNQLKDFDAWVLDTQASLDLLTKQGFDMAAAQRSLDVIGSKRPDLLAALESKNEDQIASVNGVIRPLTQQLGVQVQEAQAQVSEAERMQFLVEQGYRVVKRADIINNDLTMILLDIGPAEPALRQLKTDLAATDRMLATRNLGMAKTPFTLVKQDLRDLSMAYRDTANTATLPEDLTATLRAMVITLDNAADQMEVS